MKVIIVGAGISGLTLAAALAQLAPRIEVELYERDTAADARRKGYAIGLKTDAGLTVLERLGLLDDVLSIGAEQVTNFVITDVRGVPCWPFRQETTRGTRRTACNVITSSPCSQTR
jgi:2-polyprenyl-6-methoxyphenol hydroxylase-like FAD-dependent oxidoreductase